MKRKVCLGSWFWTFPSKVEVLHSYGKKRVADFRCCIWQSLGGRGIQSEWYADVSSHTRCIPYFRVTVTAVFAGNIYFGSQFWWVSVHHREETRWGCSHHMVEACVGVCLHHAALHDNITFKALVPSDLLLLAGCYLLKVP